MRRLSESIIRLVKVKVFQNFSILLIGNIGTQLLNLIAVMIITKVFKPDLFGTYSFMMAQAMMLAVIADLGMRTIVIRSAANGCGNLLNRYLSITIVSGLIGNFLLFFLSLLYNLFFGELLLIQIALISLYSITLSFSNSFECVYLGKQKMLPIVGTNILTSTIWLLFVFLLNGPISINLFILVFILIAALKPLMLSVTLYNKFGIRFDISNFILDLKSVFKQALPLLGLALLALPANNLANNFLAFNSTIEQVGFFSLSQKFTNPVSMILSILLTSVFPNLSILWANNNGDFQRIIFKSIPTFILIGTTLVAVFLFLINPVFKILFSVKYYNVIEILKLQIWYVFLFGIASLIGTILISMNEDKLVFKLALLNSIIMTPLLWIGSSYGGTGLSIGYLTGFVVFWSVEWMIFIRKVNMPIQINYVLIAPIGLFVIYIIYYL